MRRHIRIFFTGIPLLAGFLIITAAGLKAQTNYTLSGKVMDAVSGEMLPGAVIRLPEEGGLWTLTDTRGHFLIKLPQGNHGIEVSYIGYKPQLATVALDRDKDTVFTLMPMSYFIQGVTIFADSPAKRRDHSARTHAAWRSGFAQGGTDASRSTGCLGREQRFSCAWRQPGPEHDSF